MRAGLEEIEAALIVAKYWVSLSTSDADTHVRHDL